MDMMGGTGPWMTLLWGLVALIVLGGVVWAVHQLTDWSTPNRIDRESGLESPAQILRRRYAAGEIDEDEYHRKRQDIGEG